MDVISSIELKSTWKWNIWSILLAQIERNVKFESHTINIKVLHKCEGTKQCYAHRM